MNVQLTEDEQRGIGPHLRIWKTGEAGLYGSKVLGEEMPDAAVVVDNEDVVILKVPGYSYWCQLYGPRGYAGAEYRVYLRLRASDEDGHNVLVRLLACYPVKKPKGDD